MPPSPFFEWLTTSPWAKAMNGPEWAFPLVESLHFIGFALLIGTIAIVDLRLLGLAMGRQTVPQLASALAPWTRAGFVLMLTTGPLMFSTDAVVYHVNPSFRFKMTCLTVAIVYHFTVHRWVTKSEVPATVSKPVAAVSLALWVAVLGGGRMIAFT